MFNTSATKISFNISIRILFSYSQGIRKSFRKRSNFRKSFGELQITLNLNLQGKRYFPSLLDLKSKLLYLLWTILISGELWKRV